MTDRTALSRGDRNRNERLARLRELLPRANAILGIDLADEKQAVVLTDHDSRVLARRSVKSRAWQLGPVLDWAVGQAQRSGFVSVSVACEPTGHRWRVLDQLAADRGLALVCVQPLLVGRAREAEDFTCDKSDPKDAVLIARLAAELRCYEPERADETWARLRQLGARRGRLVSDATGCVHQLRDLLECVWPAVLDAAGKPFDSKSWCASLAVVLERAAGDLGRVRKMGWARFAAAVRRELPRWGGRRWCSRIVRGVFDALTDPAGVARQRPGGLERAELVLGDWRDACRRLTDTETRMVSVLDQLGLTEPVTSIAGLSAVSAAAILAESGDPTRFRSPRALVKHAGLCPRENTSGQHQGQARLSGRGRPGLRLAAWRAVWGGIRANPVLTARFAHLTSREHNRLKPEQARAACAAALLRWLHVVATRRISWDPAVASGAQPLPVAA